MSNEEKGDAILAQAEKKLNGYSFFGGSQKTEDAAELFVKAANLYKMAKKWDKAGAAFSKSAQCHLKLSAKHEAASNYVAAGTAFKGGANNAEAVRSLRLAVELYTDEGRFNPAAKNQKEIAEILEADADFPGAIDAYQQAADFYDGEGSVALANQCHLKVAQFAAQLERYPQAIEIYEKIANSSLDNKLLKYSVKDYFLRAGLCHLAAGDVVSAKRALERYMDMDASFSSQRECKFLQELVEAVEGYDVESFTNSVVEFDSITKLDNWKTSILLRVKKGIQSEEEEGLA